MATHIRRFVTSPQPIFESEFPFGTQTPLPLIAAAKCLVLCIEVSGSRFIFIVFVSLMFRVRGSAFTWRRCYAIAHVLPFELCRSHEQILGSRRYEWHDYGGRWSTRLRYAAFRAVSFERTYGRGEEVDCREHGLGCEPTSSGVRGGRSKFRSFTLFVMISLRSGFFH